MLRSLLHTLAISTVLTGIASAAPITFDLQNVTFGDGTAATGSFEYNPTNGAFSNFDIVTSAGSGLPSFTFTPADSQSLGSGMLDLYSNATFPDGPFDENLILELEFASPLSTSTTSDALVLGLNDSGECLDCVPYRLVTGGSVLAVPQTIAATPEPSTIALLGTGMLAIAGLMRKRFA